jgi:hypothetical protein
MKYKISLLGKCVKSDVLDFCSDVLDFCSYLQLRKLIKIIKIYKCVFSKKSFPQSDFLVWSTFRPFFPNEKKPRHPTPRGSRLQAALTWGNTSPTPPAKALSTSVKFPEFAKENTLLNGQNFVGLCFAGIGIG